MVLGVVFTKELQFPKSGTFEAPCHALAAGGLESGLLDRYQSNRSEN